MPHVIDTALGCVLRRKRRARGLTQEALGRAIGVKFQQVQKYETAANRISASRLWEISRILGEPLEAFFPEGPAVGEVTPPFPDNAEVQAFIRMVKRMGRDERLALLKLARALGAVRVETDCSRGRTGGNSL